MAPESDAHHSAQSNMECDDEKTKADKRDDAKDASGASRVKWIAAYKRNDKLKEALLSKIKVLDDYFDLLGKVGEGTFSTVHLAALKKDPSRKFAVKHLVPTCHPTRIIRELQCLQTIGGQDNVISVNVCLRADDCVAFVMPYLPHQKFSSYALKMDAAEVQLYMKNLLIALRRVHSFGIIHRDVKPSNFLYDRERKKFLLIDFGLAQPVEELIPKDPARIEKKRKRNSLNENVENPQKKRDENHSEALSVKRPVLRPLINNASIPKQTINKKTKQDAPSNNNIEPPPPELCRFDEVPKEGSHEPSKFCAPPVLRRFDEVSKEGANLSSKFSTSLNISSSKVQEQMETNAPKTVSEVEPCNPSTRSEPSCSRQKFQRLAPNSGNTCNKSSNFLVQDSQVKEKPDILRSTKNPTAGAGVFPQPTRRAPSSKAVLPCSCAGKSQICNGCMTRKAPNAARAGTPGFRPPEVLLKYQYQTTAVDVWSAGVILLSILSGCSPFFRAADDIVALAEIMTVFGITNIKNVAAKLGITVLCNEERKPHDLQALCQQLRRRKFQRRSQEDETWKDYPYCSVCYTRKHPQLGCVCSSLEGLPGIRFPDEAYDLLTKLLNVDPQERISASDALNHPFFKMDL